MNSMITATLAIVSGVITLAIISVIFSRKAQTPEVLGAAGGALSNVIRAAVSPVNEGGSFAAAGGLDIGDVLSGFKTGANLFS